MKDLTELKSWLEDEIKSCDRDAEEYFQDIEDDEAGNKELAKAEAYQKTLDFINGK